jgi:hypothetical protein
MAFFHLFSHFIDNVVKNGKACDKGHLDLYIISFNQRKCKGSTLKEMSLQQPLYKKIQMDKAILSMI